MARRAVWVLLLVGFGYGLVQVHNAKDPVRLPHFSITAER